MKKLFAGLLLLLLSPWTWASPISAGSLTIDHAWALSTATKAANGAVYLTIRNDGADADKLLSVQSAVATTTQIHQTSMVNGMMQMRGLTDGVVIAPGKALRFSPGGLHIMLIELKTPLKVGEHFTVDLNFAHAGTVEVPVEVRDRPDAADMGMKMKM